MDHIRYYVTRSEGTNMANQTSNKSGIYQLLETRIRASKDPLTCVDLYDFPEIKEITRDANRVSDYLWHMWRRGLLQRWYSPQKSISQRARFAYTWQTKYAKPNVTITEDDASVTLDFEQFTITVQRKS